MNSNAGILAHEAAPAPAPRGAPRPWWETRWFVAAMILLAPVPLLYPQVPPLVDLLGHIARYRVQLDLGSSPDLQRYFAFEWKLIGNLGADLLLIPLSRLFGLELAVKLIAISIPPLTVAGFLWVAREVHNRLPPTVAFALPFALSHPFLFGFLNYTLSMALALLAFGLWLRLGRLGKTKLRALLFVPISFVIFICHTFGWGTLGLLAFSAEAVRQHDRGISWWKAGLKAALHAAVMAGPILLMLAWQGEQGPPMAQDWFNWNLKWQWVQMALRDRWKEIDMAMMAVVAFVMFVGVRSPRLAYSRNLAFSALVLLAVYLLLPRIIFGSAYADMRLVPFIVAMAMLAIRFRFESDEKLARLLALSGVGLFVAKVALTTASLAIAARSQEARMAAFDHIPVGAASIALIGEPCPPRWALHRDSHFGALATVRRNAFTNDQWAVEGANPLTVIYRQAAPFIADPSQMVKPNGCGYRERMEVNRALARIPRGAVTHLLAVDLPPHDPRLLQGMTSLWSGEDSTLYEIRAAGAQPRSATPQTASAAARPSAARP